MSRSPCAFRLTEGGSLLPGLFDTRDCEGKPRRASGAATAVTAQARLLPEGHNAGLGGYL